MHGIAIGSHPGGNAASAATFDEYYDGAEVTDKTPGKAWGCDPPCDLKPSCIVARYNPEANQYEIISTESAVLGAPVQRRVAIPELRMEDVGGTPNLCISTMMVGTWCFEQDEDSCVPFYECENLPSP